MVTLASLWLPILLSAVFVFIASSIIHMFMPWHKSDFRMTPNEAAVMDALRPFAVPPGDYVMPKAEGMSEMNSPEYKAKRARGPVMIYTVMPSGTFSMGKSLVQWFVYLLVVLTLVAYLAARALPADASYHRVFPFVALACFLGFAAADPQNSIWYGRSWMTTFKNLFDALIYALLAAGTFGWLWPRA